MKPYLINFPPKGVPEFGFLGIAESNIGVPFNIKRIFWAYEIPEMKSRGDHAHKKTEQVLICMHGEIRVETELPDLSKNVFILNKPDVGLYLPAACWHRMIYTNKAIQLVLASELYVEEDYLRTYEEYQKYYS